MGTLGWRDWVGRAGGWRRGRVRSSGKRLRLIEGRKSVGVSNRASAQRLGVHENAIRKLVGPSKGEEVEQLAFMSAPKGLPIELPMLAAVSVTPVEPVVEPPPATTECVQKTAVVEEEAEEEPVPMSLDADAG